MDLSKKLSLIQFLIVLGLLIGVYWKMDLIEDKVERTNKALFKEQYVSKLALFNQPNENDIFLGNKDDTSLVVVYLKYGCDACKDFYFNTVKKGLIKDHKVLLRFLAHPSREVRFKKTVNAYLAFNKGELSQYMDSVFFTNSNPIAIASEEEKDLTDIEDYVIATAKKARSLDISATPITFYRKRKFIGSIPLSKLYSE